MIAFEEFLKRSAEGPVMSQPEYDVKMSRTLRKVTAEHNIHFKPDEIVCDDATADAIFEAATDLLAEAGVYNVDTNRAILLTREETKETAREVPKYCVRGGGKDRVTVKARAHNSKSPPYIFRDPLKNSRYRGITAFLTDMIDAHLSENSELGKLARQLKAWLKGIEIQGGTVGEMMWSEAIAKWKLATAKAVGQPDMFLGETEITGVPAILICFREGLYKNYHTFIPVHIMPELKLNWERLMLSFAAREMDAPRWIGVSSIIGGYARNAEESATIITASLLTMLSYAAGDWAHLAPVDIKGWRTARPALQGHSGACRAAERNIGIPTAGAPRSKNGLGSVVSLYETAAAITEQTCSGTGWAWGFPCHPGPHGEPRTDLDGEFMIKVSRAVAGLERDRANELLNKILALYEPNWEQRDVGKPFPYYYDLRTLTPKPELVSVFRQAEEKLSSLGVPVK